MVDSCRDDERLRRLKNWNPRIIYLSEGSRTLIKSQKVAPIQIVIDV